MMPRANRHCSWPGGCFANIVRNGRCEQHSFERYADPWYRKEGHEYNDTLRESIKTTVRERARYICAQCGHYPSNEVDHITPKFLGGTDLLDNLQVLCYDCHGKKSSAEGHIAQRMRRES